MVHSSKDELKALGLRITWPRVAVLDVLGEHPHATVDLIPKAVRARLGRISKQAVDDVLAASVDTGLVRRIEPAGSPALSETRTGDNHHHVVCRSCPLTTDVDCTNAAGPCLTPSDYAGYALDSADIVFWGMCPSCQLTQQSQPSKKWSLV